MSTPRLDGTEEPDALPSRMLALAHRLVCLPLVDVRTGPLDEWASLTLAAQSAGHGDEAVASRAARDTAEGQLRLLPTATELCGAVLQLRSGLPQLRPCRLSQRVARIVDPDFLVTMDTRFHPGPGETYDWAALPLPAPEKVEPLFRRGSIDTHVHLGGVLPPLFYWIPLMTGKAELTSLRRMPAPRRGHSDGASWIQAVCEAGFLRMRMLLEVLRARGGDSLAGLRARIETELRPVRGVSGLAFRDVLHSAKKAFQASPRADEASLVLGAVKPRHYAAGERWLMCAVRSIIQPIHPRSHEEDRTSRSRDGALPLEATLLRYARIRNAFHMALVHGPGTDGLTRFSENFGRRGFGWPRKHSHSARKRRRWRRLTTEMERQRMSAALTAQLEESLPLGLASDGAVHGLEIRVSPPRGAETLRTIKAWLLGVQDFLERPGVHPASFSVGLLFHFLKRGTKYEGSLEREREARRLGLILRDYPGLRPFLTGFDAAGQERLSPPRDFALAFIQLRTLLDGTRVLTGEPPVSAGFTYHVGEDTWDFLTGLRHTDEVLNLILAGKGRLGHALILGEDPERFYSRRGGFSEVPLGTHILDLVWAWGQRMVAHQGRHCPFLEQRIRSLTKRANGRDAGSRDAGASLQDVGACFERMQTPAGEAELLRILGLTGSHADMVPVASGPHWLELVSELQGMMREKVSALPVTIEANPTSNLLIGGYNDYNELPYGAFDHSHLSWSINTDDPGLFLCSLLGEYEHMYRARIGASPHRKAMEWLAGRVQDAWRSSFLPVRPLARGKKRIEKLFSWRPRRS